MQRLNSRGVLRYKLTQEMARFFATSRGFTFSSLRIVYGVSLQVMDLPVAPSVSPVSVKNPGTLPRVLRSGITNFLSTPFHFRISAISKFLPEPPHVSRKYKGSAMDGHTTRDVAYSIGIRVRKGIESIFGWMKTVGECVKRDSVDWNGFVRIVPWCPPSTIWRARNDWVWYDGKHCVQSSGNWGLFELKGKKNTSPGRSTLVFRQIRVQRQFYLRHFLQMCNIEGSQFDSRSHLAQLTRVK